MPGDVLRRHRDDEQRQRDADDRSGLEDGRDELRRRQHADARQRRRPRRSPPRSTAATIAPGAAHARDTRVSTAHIDHDRHGEPRDLDDGADRADADREQDAGEHRARERRRDRRDRPAQRAPQPAEHDEPRRRPGTRRPRRGTRRSGAPVDTSSAAPGVDQAIATGIRVRQLTSRSPRRPAPTQSASRPDVASSRSAPTACRPASTTGNDAGEADERGDARRRAPAATSVGARALMRPRPRRASSTGRGCRAAPRRGAGRRPRRRSRRPARARPPRRPGRPGCVPSTQTMTSSVPGRWASLRCSVPPRVARGRRARRGGRARRRGRASAVMPDSARTCSARARPDDARAGRPSSSSSASERQRRAPARCATASRSTGCPRRARCARGSSSTAPTPSRARSATIRARGGGLGACGRGAG